jgi:diguanylate cyclase (GGDEF)-like protein
MGRVDARLMEMQFLARLEREGKIETGEPFDGSPERQMLVSLVEQGYVNGLDTRSNNSGAPMSLMLAARDGQATDLWRLAHKNPDTANVELRMSHRGRVRLSELEQQLKTGRDRDETGLLWAKRHVLTDIAIAILAAGKDAPLSVAHLDMNGLKAINDAHGHPVGDEAIRAFFQAALATLGGQGEVYRNGGDEVVVILPGVDDEAAGKLLDGFVRQLGKEVLLLGDARAETRLTASCGSASTTEPSEDATALLKRADDAEIRAKKKSKEHSPRVSAVAVGEGQVATHAPD